MKQGEWEFWMITDETGEYHCSLCGYHDENQPDTCPRCKTNMKEEE